jgi:hypothetical protein
MVSTMWLFDRRKTRPEDGPTFRVREREAVTRGWVNGTVHSA